MHTINRNKVAPYTPFTKAWGRCSFALFLSIKKETTLSTANKALATNNAVLSYSGCLLHQRKISAKRTLHKAAIIGLSLIHI